MARKFKRVRAGDDWTYTVVGYWTEPVRVYAPRRWNAEQSYGVSHSLGGQDGAVPELDALANFAAALLDAVAFARKMNAKLTR